MRVITYDLETLNTIEEAGGWDRHDRLGVSVLCAHDSETGRYMVFSDHLPEPWQTLYEVEPLQVFNAWAAAADYLVGFNNSRFDNEVLAWNGVTYPRDHNYRRGFDILIESWVAQKLNTSQYDKATHSGSLNDYARANLGVEKSASGEPAPKLWAQGRYREVVEYCLLDVRITRALFGLIQSRGWLDNPKTGVRVQFPALTGGE